MNYRSRSTAIAVVLAATLAACSGVLHANAQPFFKPSNGGKDELVYV